MPKVSDHKEARLRRIIRDAMAIDPLISMNGLQRAVEKKIGRPIDEVYLKKLVNKTTGEMVIVADREKVEERISYLRERNRIICDELLRMAFPDPNSPDQPGFIDRRKALESISNIEARQVKLEMDLGLFTRQLGTIEIEHRLKPIDETTLQTIVATFRAWSTPPQMRKIEAVRVVDAQPTIITNEPTNEQPRPITVAGVVTGAGLVPTE